MQRNVNSKGSYHNLCALAEAGPGAGEPQISKQLKSRLADGTKTTRLIIVANNLPLRAKRSVDNSGWEFEWDEDALIAQAKEGIPSNMEVLYVGSPPVEIVPEEQETVSSLLKRKFSCSPVYLDPDVKDKYYKGCCKQQLWPLFHYVLPVHPTSTRRFDPDLWQGYIKANKTFMEKVVEESATDSDFVWIHDYHLIVLPSFLRKRFNRIRCGIFLHCPFPSSEIFRTFPKREELLRSLLNADLVGFHTFDYARHFLSCCSRMLGLEHETSRGSITLDYYGRSVALKIMPTGIRPQRYLDGFEWDEFRWRRGELAAQFAGKQVLVGVDDMDVFKGIELKLQAFDRFLERHPEWKEKVVLVQITNPPRSSGRDVMEMHSYVTDLARKINERHGTSTSFPMCYLERHVPLHERMAFYSIADCAVVTCTRDGMNLVPYEYVVCRQGPDSDTSSAKEGMLIVSEFVGCSPSLSGAIRVNPWSIEAVADAFHAAIKLPREHRRLRHEKHWKYVSHHTVAYWAQSYVADLVKVTKDHVTMKCYGLGLGLDTFRMVALDANFRRLEERMVHSIFLNSHRRMLFFDYDYVLARFGSESHDSSSLLSSSTHSHQKQASGTGTGSFSLAPSAALLALLSRMSSDPSNAIYLFSGRTKADLTQWFSSVPEVGLVAENGCFYRPIGSKTWIPLAAPHTDLSWMELTKPILQQYVESTDGSCVEVKESALVWDYRDADPDFGSWQAKELLDHLEDVLSNKPVEIVGGSQGFVEIKPQGVSKGQALELLLLGAAAMQGPVSSSSSSPSTCTSSTSCSAAIAATAYDGASNSHRGSGLASDQGVCVSMHSETRHSVSFAPSTVDDWDSQMHAGAGVFSIPLSDLAAAQATLSSFGQPDFVLCIGDDRTDEDMYKGIESYRKNAAGTLSHQIFACTVGQKPSKAPFYLNDLGEVEHLMSLLGDFQMPLMHV